MKARKGEMAGSFLMGFFVGMLIAWVAAGILASWRWIPDEKALWIEQGNFTHKEVVYKVTEYSKLKYPKKGVQNEKVD